MSIFMIIGIISVIVLVSQNEEKVERHNRELDARYDRERPEFHEEGEY